MRKRKKRKTGLGLTVLIVMAICGFVSIKRITLESEEEKVRAAYEAAEKAYKEEEERTKDLEELELYVQTKKFYEEVAREKFGLVYDDEIIFKGE